MRHAAPKTPAAPISIPNPGVEAGFVGDWVDEVLIGTIGSEDDVLPVGTDVEADVACGCDGSVTSSTIAKGEKLGVSAVYVIEFPSLDRDTRDVASFDHTPFS